MTIKINFKDIERPIESVEVEFNRAECKFTLTSHPLNSSFICMSGDLIYNSSHSWDTTKSDKYHVHKDCIDDLIEALKLAKEKL